MPESTGNLRNHWPDVPDEVSRIVRRKLEALTAECPTLDASSRQPGHRVSLARDQSQLLRMVLEDILGFQNLGRFEKTAWEIHFGYRGAFCVAAFRKFGLSLEIYTDTTLDSADSLADELVELLASALKIVERRVFQDFIAGQVKDGAIGVVNQYFRLRAMYIYFRELTDAAHGGSGQLSNLPSSSGAWLLPTQTEGFYTTVAMVNAYFSYLEHLFVLMLPFSGFDRSRENLVDFIGSIWGDKYKRIFPTTGSREAQRFYERLRGIAEEFRNTHVHGGFNKSHGGLIVHCVGGALRADVVGQRDKPYFELVPVDQDDFEHICLAFDEFDNWLSQTYGHRWASAGLTVAFDEDTVAKYATAMENDDDFAELLERTAYLEDQYANMDW